MTTCTDPPRKGSPALTRRVFMLGGAGAAVAGLTACDGPGSLLPTRRPRLESGVTGIVTDATVGALPDPTAFPDDLGHVIEVPGARCRVVSAQRLSALPVASLASLGLDRPEDLEQGTEEVAPATGEVFLHAVLSAEPPVLLPAPDAPSPAAIEVRVAGSPVASIPLADLVPHNAHTPPHGLTLSVAEDVAAEDVVLNLEWDGVDQQLSLVDGTRLPSEADVLYTEPLTAEVEDNWWEREDPGDPHRRALGGYVGPVELRDVAPDLTWAEPGTAFLGVRAQSLGPGGRWEGTLDAVTLADGTEIAPWGEQTPAGPDLAEVPTWFEVPREAGALIVRLQVSAENAEGDPVDLGTEDVTVTIREVDG